MEVLCDCEAKNKRCCRILLDNWGIRGWHYFESQVLFADKRLELHFACARRSPALDLDPGSEPDPEPAQEKGNGYPSIKARGPRTLVAAALQQMGDPAAPQSCPRTALCGFWLVVADVECRCRRGQRGEETGQEDAGRFQCIWHSLPASSAQIVGASLGLPATKTRQWWFEHLEPGKLGTVVARLESTVPRSFTFRASGLGAIIGVEWCVVVLKRRGRLRRGEISDANRTGQHRLG